MRGAWRRVSVLGLSLVLIAQPLAAQAGGKLCATPAEEQALNMRVLQSELMVAALNCGYSAQYNKFVTRFQPQLAVEGKVLKGYFVRSYGKSGVAELDRFVTRAANEASKVNMRQGTRFCADLGEAFRTLAQLEQKKLGQFAATWPRASSHGMSRCKTETIAKAD